MRNLMAASGLTMVLLALSPQADGAPKAGTKEIRRDPRGITGISPYMEQLARGREAFVRNDVSGAIAAFQKAINLARAAPLGYTLLAQAQMANGDLQGAAQTLESAKSARGPEADNAKLLQVGGEHAERAASKAALAAPTKDHKALWEKAKKAWDAYLLFASAHPAAAPHGAAATERKAQVTARMKRDADYVIVRKRIRDNAKEREKKKESE